MKFIEYVTREVYARNEDNLQNVTMVFPNRRAGTFVRDALSAIIDDKPVCSPQCTTISDLFNDLCPLSAADELEAVFRLYNIFSELQLLQTEPDKKVMSLDGFYGWGRQLIADFNNIDMNYRDTDAVTILRNAAEARDFDTTNVADDVKARIEELMHKYEDAEAKSFRKNFQLLWAKLPDIYTQLNNQLKANNKALSGARYKWVVRNFNDSYVQDKIKNRTYVFCGFNILQATERTLMEKLQTAGKAQFIWDFDATLCEKAPHIHAYDAVKSLRDGIFKSNSISEENATEIPQIDVICSSSDNAQARYAHQWLLDCNTKGGTAAVVLCNEGMLESVIYSIPGEINQHVNITKGLPMRNTKIYAQIRQWFEQHADLSGAQCFEQLLAYIDGLKEPASAEQPAPAAQSSWHKLLYEESLYQARCAVVSLANVINSGLVTVELKPSTLRNLVMRHLEAVSIPFHGEPATDLQIIGVLETRSLDFDHVLLLNVEDGVLPHRSADNSFIPYYLREYYNLTTAKDQNAVYAYNFFRLFHRAKDVTIVYSEAQTSTGQRTMSPFVMQILLAESFKVNRRQLVMDSLVAPISIAPAAVSAQESFAPTSLSPSAINTFLSCKRRYYYERCLKLSEPDTHDYLLQANELGTIVHAAVEKFYRDCYGKCSNVVQQKQIDAALANEKYLQDCIAWGWAQLNNDYRKHNNLPDGAPDNYNSKDHPAENSVILRHLKNVLEYDKTCAPITILGLELKAYHDITLADGRSVSVGGIVDRLDKITENGEQVLRIVDYKTGKYEPSKLKAEDMDDAFTNCQKRYVRQTLIYSYVVSELSGKLKTLGPIGTYGRMQPILLFSYKNLTDEKTKKDIDIATNCVDNFENDYKADTEDRLKDLLTQILDEKDFAQTGVENKECKYCPFVKLCGKENEVSVF